MIMMFGHERKTVRPVTTTPAWQGSSIAEGKVQLFAKLMDEEISKLEKGPDEPITGEELLDALRAVHDRAPTEIQEDIYALARELVEALKERVP